MAENEIEIEVVLNAKGAEEGLERIQEGGDAVGETFKGVGETVSSIGGEMNERLGAVGESVGGLTESMISLKDATSGSNVSLMGILGPLGAVAMAVVGVTKAMADYFEVTEKADIRREAYAASTSELTTAIEELAAQQVSLTKAEVDELRVLSMRAKLPIETAQGIRDRNAARAEELFKLNARIKGRKRLQKEERMNYGFQVKTEVLMRRRDKLQAKLNARQAEAVRLTTVAMADFALFEAKKLEHEKKGLIALKERAKVEEALMSDMMIAELKAQKQTEETKIRIAVAESQKKINDINRMEDVDRALRAQMVTTEEKVLQHTVSEIQKAEETKRQAEQAKLTALRKVRVAKRLAQERILQSELARIRRAEIENMKITGADALDVLQHQETLALKLAGDNANARIAIQMEFENRRLSIQQEAEEKRIDDAKEAAEKARELEDKRRAFMLESAEFDIRMSEDGLNKELDLLNLKYRREMSMAERTAEELTDLKRRHEIERARIVKDSAISQVNAIAETTSALSNGLAQSAYNAILFGSSFKEGVGQILVALGQQASVESLMELAKGTASLFLNPPAAANHFAASGLYATAAIAAGSAGAALGGGGGGGGGSAPATSSSTPTDSPTTAPSPERAQADSSAMVFNINFGNSTIYDTKRAAQDAMADQILRTINRQRRGAPRFAMG